MVWALICALLVGTAPAGAAGEPRPDSYKLPNGLKVIIVEDHSYPVVACMAWYKVGSRNEQLGTTGISHLVEHLLMRTAGSFRSGEMGALTARAGGQFNGFTSDDFTTFFELLPSSRLELGLLIESERMKSAVFTARDVQDEVARIQDEFENEAKDGVQTLMQEVRSLTFQQHAYHTPTMGWRTDVENLTAQQAQQFYDQHFRPDNSTLVLVGDVKAQSVRSLVQKYFGALQKSRTATTVASTQEQPQRGERRLSMKYTGRQEVLHVAYHAPAVHESEAPAMAVMQRLLNASYSGRLKQKLVGAKVCSSAVSAFEMKKDPGLFTITCYAAPGNTQEDILEALDGLVNQLRSQPISDTELRRAKNRAEFNYYNECDGPYRAAFHLGYFDCLSEWQNSYSWPERLRAVTAADVQRAAKRFFNPDTRVVGWLSTPNAPKPPEPKPAPEAPAGKDKEKEKQKDQPKSPHQRQAMGLRMMGYKADDSSPGPMIAQGNGSSLMSPASAIMPPDAAKVAGKAAAGVGTQESGSAAAGGSAGAGTSNGARPSSVASVQPVVTQDVPAGEAQPKSPAATPADAGALMQSTPSRPLPSKGAAKSPPETKVRRAQQKVLKNGINLVVFESHLSPVVQIMGAIRAGNICDPAGKKGISAVTAACMASGSSKRNRTQLVTLQEDMGLPTASMIRFNDGMEAIKFETRCHSRDLATQLSNITEIVSSPAIGDADVEKAKQDVLADIKRVDETLNSRVERALLRSLIAPGTPFYPPDNAERAKAIGAFKAADVKAFHSQFVAPNVTTLVLAGDIDIEQAAQLCERTLGNWTGKAGSPRQQVHQTPKKILRTTIPKGDSAEGMVCLGQLLSIPRNHQDYGELLLADCALNNHPLLSRLGKTFVSEPKLAEAVGSEDLRSKFEPIGSSTVWSLSLALSPDVVSRAVQSLLGETRKFGKAGITVEELNEAKRYLLGAIPVRSMATVSTVAKTFLESALQCAGDGDQWPKVAGGIAGATVDSVNKFIRSVMKPDQSVMIVAGKGETIKTIRKEVQGPANGKAATTNGGRSGKP